MVAVNKILVVEGAGGATKTLHFLDGCYFFYTCDSCSVRRCGRAAVSREELVELENDGNHGCIPIRGAVYAGLPSAAQENMYAVSGHGSEPQLFQQGRQFFATLCIHPCGFRSTRSSPGLATFRCAICYCAAEHNFAGHACGICFEFSTDQQFTTQLPLTVFSGVLHLNSVSI